MFKFIRKNGRFAVIVLAMVAIVNVRGAAAQAKLTPQQIVDRVVSSEQELTRTLAGFSPLVETYIQNLEADQDLGTAPKSDKYFLGKLNLTKGISRSPFRDEKGFAQGLRDSITTLYSVKFLPGGFAQMALVDERFDRSRYNFEYIRSEFLGEVRCLVFDVGPKVKTTRGAFLGRIWVEDRDYHIVRFNGTYNNHDSGSKMYFHFDSWRQQMGPNLWLPASIYVEESDREYFFNTRKLQFKAQTRFFGYNIGRSKAQSEFTSLTVESDKVSDVADAAEHVSPVMSRRLWERQAEDNVLQRMERAGVLAPSGEVDKVLATVVNNLEVTNNLSIEPEVRCRVLLTSPLESFTIGNTIVLSRGLIDVLPDEASLAMVLAYELGHIVLGHRVNTKFAFSDRMLFEDHETFHNLFVKRSEVDEKNANRRAMEMLRKSPYADKLASAGLFLRALSDRSKRLPNLLQGNMGSRMASGGEVRWVPELMQVAPRLQKSRVDQVAALPLGGRIRVDPWDNRIELLKTKPVNLVSASEKMQFEIAPIFLYLTRQESSRTTAASRNNN